jgi:hypothetical protein
VTYRIYYMKPDYFAKFIHGIEIPTRQQLEETHVHLLDLEASTLDAIFSSMQGEVWSPNGEARSLIKGKGLAHTSMSIGDVVEDIDTGEMFACAFVGWSKMEERET